MISKSMLILGHQMYNYLSLTASLISFVVEVNFIHGYNYTQN